MAALKLVALVGLICTLTNGLALAAGHWWSARSELAFVSNRDGNNEIYLLDTARGVNLNLTRHPADDYDPAWSPDGTRIVFVSNRDGNYDIYLMNSDGRDLRQLTNTIVGTNQNPAWSADGESILYTANGLLTGPNGVYRYRLAADRAEFVSAEDYSGLRSGFLDTSADGRTVRSTSIGRQRDLYVLTRENRQQVTYISGDKYYPVWSPDGQWIAYQSMLGLSLQIFMVDADGQFERRLTFNGGNYYPAWRP